MATFVRGDVVVVPFPFSDLSQAKRRPALVVAVLDGDNLILCQITSQAGDRSIYRTKRHRASRSSNNVL